MTKTAHLISKTSYALAAFAICLLLIAVSGSAQTAAAPTQQDGSLADVARKMRAQKGDQVKDDVNRAQQDADELSEDQNNKGQRQSPTPDAKGNASASAATAEKPAGTNQDAAVAPSNPAPANQAPAVTPDKPAQDKQAQAALTPTQPASTVPAGFKVHPFTYCGGPQHCWNASVLITADAQLVSSDCKQFIFTSKAQGTPFFLMAGQENCDAKNGPDPVRWKQLIDPESKRPPGTYNTISSQNTTFNGKPAILTTLGFRLGMDSWMGKRIEVESNGVALVVGCIAPRDNFPDVETVCSKLIESLQMP